MDAVVYDPPSSPPSPSEREGKGRGAAMKIVGFILVRLREFGKYARKSYAK
jgi:hypothetical protein